MSHNVIKILNFSIEIFKIFFLWIELFEAFREIINGRCQSRLVSDWYFFCGKICSINSTIFANMFIPVTSKDWIPLHASLFPDFYNLQTFKIRVKKHFRLHSLAWLISPFLFDNAKVSQDILKLNLEDAPFLHLVEKNCPDALLLLFKFSHFISLKIFSVLNKMFTCREDSCHPKWNPYDF